MVPYAEWRCRACPEPLLCREGRTTIYGASDADCSAFRTLAEDFSARIHSWTAVANQTEEASYPGCRSALEVFYCSQQPIYREDSEVVSKCSVYRRPDHENVHRCLAFCPAIRDSCPLIASTYCEDRCRTTLANDYCRVLEITGLDAGRFPVETLDMMNKFRIEAEADEPLLRDGRPAYRSIPARRPSRFGGRSTKLDYFLYSTRIRGFNEWLLDTNDIDTDGAVAHASDSNILPYMINSDWSVWWPQQSMWLGEPIRVTCLGDTVGSAAPHARGGGWSIAALPLTTLATVMLLLSSRRQRRVGASSQQRASRVTRPPHHCD